MFLQSELERIEKAIPHIKEQNETVSSSTVGWQLDHVLQVFNGVANTLRKSNPSEYKRDINMPRLLIFSTGRIPRGAGKAPKEVSATTEVIESELREKLSKAQHLASQIGELPAKSYFKHAIFGMLHKKKTMRFLAVHTRHHLKIVDDILKKK